MAGHSYSDLPKPRKPYRLDRDTRHEDGIVRHRSLEAALRRDIRRAKFLEDTADLSKWEAERAKDLHERVCGIARWICQLCCICRSPHRSR